MRGLETFSTKFFVKFEARREGGVVEPCGAVRLTPEIYSRLRGPYNRRNVYGAAIAYAPVLPADLRDAVLDYALCLDAPLLKELGIANPCEGATASIHLEPLPATPLDLPMSFKASCR